MLPKIKRLLANNTNILMILFFIVFGACQLYLAKHESAIIDEYPHIASGINYFRNDDMTINSEHPPLFKLAAAIVPIINDVQWPDKQERNQWVIGEMLLTKYYAYSPLLWWARIGVIALNLSLIILAYKTLSYRYKRSIAAIVMILFCLNPLVLAHSHYVTNDISAALVSFIFILMMMNRLDHKTQNTKNSWMRLSGIIFLMIITKYSLLYILGFAYLFVLMAVFIGSANNKAKAKRVFIDFNKALLLALGIVYILYFILTYKQSALLTEEIVRGTGLQRPLNPSLIALMSVFNNTLLRPLIPLFAGIVFVLSRVSNGGETYLHLTSYTHGVKQYFPFVFLVKNTISFLVAIVFSALVGIKARRDGHIKKGLSLASIFIIGFVFFYTISAILGHLNIGIRHLSPIILPICLFIALSLHAYYNVVLIILMGSLLEVLPSIFIPMSFSNFIIGGVNQTYYYVNDSNLDWGQSKIRLKEYLTHNDKFKDTNIALVLWGQHRSFQHYFCPDPATEQTHCILDIKGADGENATANIFYWGEDGLPPDTDYLIISNTVITSKAMNRYAGLEKYPHDIFDGTMMIYKLR